METADLALLRELKCPCVCGRNGSPAASRMLPTAANGFEAQHNIVAMLCCLAMLLWLACTAIPRQQLM